MAYFMGGGGGGHASDVSLLKVAQNVIITRGPVAYPPNPRMSSSR